MGYHEVGIPMNRAPEARPQVSPWRASRERGEAVGWSPVQNEHRKVRHISRVGVGGEILFAIHSGKL